MSLIAASEHAWQPDHPLQDMLIVIVPFVGTSMYCLRVQACCDP